MVTDFVWLGFYSNKLKYFYKCLLEYENVFILSHSVNIIRKKNKKQKTN